MIFLLNLLQQLNGNDMHYLFIKIFLFFIFIVLNLSSCSQNIIKFGYHDNSGKVKNIENDKQQINQIDLDNNDTLPNNFTQDEQIIENDSLIDSVNNINDTIKISVLLPFRTSKNQDFNDYLLNYGKDTNQIFDKSIMAISFLEGVIFSLDSLSKLGIPVILNVYDTENNLDTVREIVLLDFVESSDVIFGPIYYRNFNLVRNFFKDDTSKILINPLSNKIKLLEGNQNVFFLNPLEATERDSIVACLKDYGNDVIIIIDGQDQSNRIAELKKSLTIDTVDFIIHQFMDLSEINYNKCNSLVSDSFKSIIVLSKDELFINTLISTFAALNDTSILIMGHREWLNIPELNTKALMKLNVHLPLLNYISRNSKSYKSFLENFEESFFHQMDNFSMISFRALLHFCSNISQFNFSKYHDLGGYINTNISVHKYLDYELVPLE